MTLGRWWLELKIEEVGCETLAQIAYKVPDRCEAPLGEYLVEFTNNRVQPPDQPGNAVDPGLFALPEVTPLHTLEHEDAALW